MRSKTDLRSKIYICKTKKSQALQKKMSAMSLKENIFFFMESCNISKKPPSTLMKRVTFLRILYSIRDIDVENVVRHMEDFGIDLGTYDVQHTKNINDRQKLTRMSDENWAVLMSSIFVDDFETLCLELQKEYHENIFKSPFWALKTLFDDNGINKGEKAVTFVRIFLILYNKEARRDMVMKAIIKTKKNESFEHLAMLLLGNHMCDVAREDLERDVGILMKYVDIKLPNIFFDASATPVQFKSNERGTEVKSSSRISLLNLRKIVLQNKMMVVPSSTESKNQTWKPVNLPIIQNTWDRLTRAQQQVIVLIASLRLDGSGNKEKLTKLIFPNYVESGDFLQYELSANDAMMASNVITSVLLRISFSMDHTESKLINLINRFTQECFKNTLGETQQNIMSLTLKTQIFISAYLINKVKHAVFESCMRHFNERAFGRTKTCLLYTSPSPRDQRGSRMPSSA